MDISSLNQAPSPFVLPPHNVLSIDLMVLSWLKGEKKLPIGGEGY
jgi:hypothetical protein